jgi:type II secretory pathway component HofQ
MKALHFGRWACAIFVTSACAMGAAQTKTIYRCGTTYSDTPCGQGVIVPTADPRTAAQKAQTQEASARSASLAGQLEKARRTDEAAALQRTQAQALDQARSAKKATKPQAKKAPKKAAKKAKPTTAVGAASAQVKKPKLNKPKQAEAFTALVPAPPNAKK